VVTAYRNYEFHKIYQEVHNFCVVELGGFYLDIIKDRLYTTGTSSKPRRSAQTALYHLAHAMVRWLAPILSFTAEEVWKHLPGTGNESVFLNVWHQFPSGAERPLNLDWPALIALKSDVAKELEGLRTAGGIGSSSAADVIIHADTAHINKYRALGDELRFLLITGDAKVAAASEAPEGAAKASEEGVWIQVKPSPAPKCVRCYQHRADIGKVAAHPEICVRCAGNVDGPGEERLYA
jgi:isoleucyl-tRNA synthetase